MLRSLVGSEMCIRDRRMLITLTPGGTGRRKEVALQIQEVAPTYSRGGPHHVCGVTLCSMWHFALRVDQEVAPQIQEVAPTTCVVWHFALCGEWILEVAPTDSRGGPTTCVVWHFALCDTYSVWGMDSRGGPHGFKRWPPPCVWCGTLLRVGNGF